MATQSWLQSTALDRLLVTPERFEFVQSLRLLEHHYTYQHKLSSPLSSLKSFINLKTLPHHENIRLCSTMSLSFEATDLLPHKHKKDEITLKQFNVSFLKIAGQSGALPLVFTELVLERNRLGDNALKDFLDMFHHRLLSMFYQACLKYNILLKFEKQEEGKKDVVARAFQSLHGNGIKTQNDNTPIDSPIGVFYAGLLAQRPRTLMGLERILTSYYELPLRCEQFNGSWLMLQPREWSRLPHQQDTQAHHQLGKGALLGTKVWTIDQKFTLIIGPLSFIEFVQFLPENRYLIELKQIINYYIHPYLRYNIQLILKGNEVPSCQLGNKSVSQLGWNSWLHQTEPFTDRYDTILKAYF